MSAHEIARASSERGEVVLRQREDGAVELRVNGVFVMDTVEVRTEQALASQALQLLDQPRDVLIGGLGLGFTIRAALADPRVRRCVVVEIEAALVDWLRDGTVPHGPAMLTDDRLEILVADVASVVERAEAASYDLVLLDVDNGPGYLVHTANAGLYEHPFLIACRRLLRPGGALVVWSAAAAPALEKALGEAFGSVEARPFTVDLQGRDEQYWLYTSVASQEWTGS